MEGCILISSSQWGAVTPLKTFAKLKIDAFQLASTDQAHCSGMNNVEVLVQINQGILKAISDTCVALKD